MRLLSRFAPLLEYPGPALLPAIDRCIEGCEAGLPAAAELLRSFRPSALDLPRLEQAYTDTFELRAEATPYVGHHLFGEDIRRSLFLARLKRRCAELGVPCGTELPDHLAIVLRLLAAESPGADTDELLRDCALPALRRMLEAAGPPYAGPLRATLLALDQRQKGDAAWRPSSSSRSRMSR